MRYNLKRTSIIGNLILWTSRAYWVSLSPKEFVRHWLTSRLTYGFLIISLRVIRRLIHCGTQLHDNVLCPITILCVSLLRIVRDLVHCRAHLHDNVLCPPTILCVSLLRIVRGLVHCRAHLHDNVLCPVTILFIRLNLAIIVFPSVVFDHLSWASVASTPIVVVFCTIISNHLCRAYISFTPSVAVFIWFICIRTFYHHSRADVTGSPLILISTSVRLRLTVVILPSIVRNHFSRAHISFTPFVTILIWFIRVCAFNHHGWTNIARAPLILINSIRSLTNPVRMMREVWLFLKLRNLMGSCIKNELWFLRFAFRSWCSLIKYLLRYIRYLWFDYLFLLDLVHWGFNCLKCCREESSLFNSIISLSCIEFQKTLSYLFVCL